MTDTYDLLLSGGTLLDPATGRHQKLDVGIIGGRIAAIQSALPLDSAKRVLDVRGYSVTPGLIDFHIHSYWGVNPYGFDADPICIASGVTTAVDAGSAGPVNFLGFKRFISEKSRTRMLAFVCVAQHGVLTAPGELSDLRFADPEGAAQSVKEDSDVAVGIKVRLHRGSVGNNGPEALRLAIQAGEASRSPVMVHIGDTGISIEEIVDTLRPGDIVTHCYTPKRPSILDETGRLRNAVRRARERGVLFDVGHANGHFDFNLVRRAMGEGLLPDTISSDLHSRMGPSNPVVDLPTTMTKFLALGLSLEKVLAACTINPARAMGWQDRLGNLETGRQADLAVLEIVDGPIKLRDCVGGELIADRRIAARWTIRGGEVFEGSG
ncbi:MAG TPA: amidohydrolase/deacetylase family metallohydrolase [Candidatus Binatia bacterium]|jgi:dihydroorotase|nr:amidohydrolase/deacetylase family metallohydrolase [Candidatus Binatia bacterium]